MKLDQKMGYDRSITMFSPDGRLLQVEYAKKTVRQGSTAVGIVCKDGVVLVADKRINGKLIIPESVEKMFKIDDHIGATASGIISDARVLVDRSQLKAQQHSVTYDSAIDVLTVVKEICDLKQMTTQSAGLRPFGVALLIAGVEEDHSIKLYMTDPTGIYFQYRAAVIGEGEPEIEKILQSKWKASLSMDDGLSLAIKAMKQVLGKEFSIDRIDASYVSSKDRRYRKFKSEKIRERA
ncbi:MAG: proteasome endopeptidase complex, archaeal, alpha subunit [Nanoarchaeota archaeon]|nr:proteasome endopeptidase complex, archaeal, alpha subunit [Nanoarchaeota archaeon]|tara:strand:+ start:2589 stop:3299 length:711 start_codon:yes stop_codon:yes gene_type:complete